MRMAILIWLRQIKVPLSEQRSKVRSIIPLEG